MNDELGASRLTLEKIQVGVRAAMSPSLVREMKHEAYQGAVTDQVVHTVRLYLWANQMHKEVLRTVRYPATWWDGFKEAHYPNWAKRQWPSRFVQEDVELRILHLCPHLNIGRHEEERIHLAFLMPPP